MRSPGQMKLTRAFIGGTPCVTPGSSRRPGGPSPDLLRSLLLSHPKSSLGSAGEYVAKILLLTCCYQERSKAGALGCSLRVRSPDSRSVRDASGEDRWNQEWKC